MGVVEHGTRSYGNARCPLGSASSTTHNRYTPPPSLGERLALAGLGVCLT